jgi:hypothetical protein
MAAHCGHFGEESGVLSAAEFNSVSAFTDAHGFPGHFVPMHFATYKAAAEFARQYARKLKASARIARDGSHWTVYPGNPMVAVCDAELDHRQRTEGKALFLNEIAETVAHLRASQHGQS